MKRLCWNTIGTLTACVNGSNQFIDTNSSLSQFAYRTIKH